ncbi:MAG: hypothetical protein ACYC0B_02240 [Gemmatimonadaceae bacterium]
MSHPADERAVRPLESKVTLGYGESIDIDVAFCDLVLAQDPEVMHDVRFRGTERPSGARVRLWIPLEEIEGPLVHEGVLRQHVKGRMDLSVVDKGNSLAIPLEQWKLRITKHRTGNGRWKYTVEALDPSRAEARGQRIAAEYLRDIRIAADEIAPQLTERGHAVGSAEIISIAGELFARRSHQA